MFLMLSVLATAKGPLTVRDILAKLPKKFRTHVRSVQRDLKHLAKWAPLSVDQSEKPYRWGITEKSSCPCCQRKFK